MAGGFLAVVLTPVEQPFPGTFPFAAEKGMRDTVDHTLAVAGAKLLYHGDKKYNVYFFVSYQSRGRWAVQSGK